MYGLCKEDLKMSLYITQTGMTIEEFYDKARRDELSPDQKQRYGDYIEWLSQLTEDV